MNIQKSGIFILLLICAAHFVHAQVNNLAIRAYEEPPSDFFRALSLQSGINIIYSDNLIERLPLITLEMKGVSVETVIKEVLAGTLIDYKIVDQQIVLFQAVPPPINYSISGILLDSISGEPLIYAYVHDEISGKSTLTNEYGYFSLYLPSGDVNLLAGYSGYIPYRQHISLGANKIMHLKLLPNAVLPEVIVTDRKTWFTDPLPRWTENITFKDLVNNIQLGGASDLYRAADFIPGVHTGTDGVGGIHVRGGANDQNLILMDGVPVYHPNHLLGIVSVFNYQVVQHASVYKANFPSRFSGRLSSVIDVRIREGNIHNWGVSGNVGFSEFGLMAEGPIIPGKVGVLFTGRFFPPGLFMRDFTRAFKEKNGIEGYTDMDYADFNAKINWKAGLRDRLYVSMYYGTDRFTDFTITEKQEIDSNILIVSHEEFDKDLNWTNRTGVFRWNHIVSDKIFSNLIISTSSFFLQSIDKSRFSFEFPGTSISPLFGFDTKEFKSSIHDVTAKIELDIRPSADHQINAGAYAIDYLFTPKSISHNEDSDIGGFPQEDGLIDDDLFADLRIRALEAGLYFEDNWDIRKNLHLSSGIHISGFFVQDIYYLDPQLRMSLDYEPLKNLALNVGYSRMAQHLHNLTSSSIGLPTDLWVPTTSRVSPALADQYSIASIWQVDDHFSVDLSAYVKDMRNLISYQEGASFLVGPLEGSIIDAGNWETKITEGNGDAEGVELQMRYENNTIQCKLNGTWSRSFRTFPEINNGKSFPDRYDRRWSSTFTGQLLLGPKWSAGVNFIYGTGIAITLAESKFVIPGSLFPVVGIGFTDRNAFRLPSYHRLDLILTHNMGENKNFQHSLSLNLYNVYNRTNPFYITLVQEEQTFKFKQFSLFKFFPSLTYRFAFPGK